VQSAYSGFRPESAICEAKMGCKRAMTVLDDAGVASELGWHVCGRLAARVHKVGPHNITVERPRPADVGMKERPSWLRKLLDN